MQFWLRYVEHVGGLWEDSGDSTVVVLPDRLQDKYGHPDDVRVTVDPDVARDDGATLLLAGHPWLQQAAESVIGEGDCGLLRLPRPAAPTPGSDQLLAAAREQFPVDHGRIDATGGPAPGVRPLLRVGALASYAVSSDVTFQEQMTCWVDIPTCLEVTDEVVGRLAGLVDVDHAERDATQPAAGHLVPALRRVDQRIHERASQRASELSRQVADECHREIERTTAYYTDAVRSLQRRLDTASPERANTLVAKIQSSEAECDRRLAEIAEKYRATHTIVPFRLHIIAVPVLRLPVDVRRGERRYPLTLDWLLSARSFAPIRCPACHGAGPLVAGKTGLSCQDCVRGPERGTEPSVAPKSTPVAEPPAPTTPPGSLSPVRHARREPVGRAFPSAPRTPQAIQKAGRKLVTSVWDLAAAGDRRVQRLYAPQSPAAAMHVIFGAAGPLRAVGFDAREVPHSMTGSDSAPAHGATDVQLIDGHVQTANGCYGYQMCWRFIGNTPLIEEITPFDGAYWPRQPEPCYYPGGATGRRLYAASPAARAQLDPVAAEVWGAVAIYGLSLTLRALAAWWRIAEPDAALSHHSPGALAAALVRTVAYRAGTGGRFDDAAGTFRVEVDAVRAAGTDVQRRLRLSERPLW